MATHVQPIDPNNVSADPHLQCKQCMECRAILPIAHFGSAKYSKGKIAKSCNLCRGQYQRRNRKRKYNAKSEIDDSIIRNVRFHNTAILTASMFSTLEIRAFNTVSKVDYKVFFGPSKFNGMHSIAFFDSNAQLYREFNYSGGTLQPLLESILAILRNHDLRLEYTDADVLTSKATIYYV
jgi:hypothetical protein